MSKTNILEWLEQYYARHCDGDWEHSYGIEISNIDNPGWVVKIDLNDTKLSDIDFTPINSQRDELNWVICEKRGEQFFGAGGVRNLDEILEIFRSWSEENLSYDENVWL
jgi:hypothetical protein